MVVKYVILTFLAIQAIHAGVIKSEDLLDGITGYAEEPCSELDKALQEVTDHAVKASYLQETIGVVFADNTTAVLNIAKTISTASQTVLTEFERFSVGLAPWTVRCFENVQDQADVVNGVLTSTTKECIRSEESSVSHHKEEIYLFQERVYQFSKKIQLDYDKCKDAQCQEQILRICWATTTLLSLEYEMLDSRISSYLQAGFEDMKECSAAAYGEPYIQQMKEILNNIQKCVDAGPIKIE